MFIFAAAWLAGRVPGEKAFPQPVRAIAGKKNEKQKDMEYDLITILGPTASGKTALAAALACEMHSEVISGDSRQVYRRMDLGTGKDLDDYVVGGTEVPYHLIDIAEPGTKYNVFEFQRDFRDVYSRLRERGIVPILCGGTGLYLESVLRGYRLMPVPENAALREALSEKTLEELTGILKGYKQLHNTTDVDTKKRAIRAIEIEEYYARHPLEGRDFPNIRALVVGIGVDRDTRRARITERLKQRLDAGMLDEIRRLLGEGIPADDLIYYGLEYKYLTQYVLGEYGYDEMFRKLETAIHQFAKRQMTWFRGMERRGITIHWLDAALPLGEKVEQVRRLCGGFSGANPCGE